MNVRRREAKWLCAAVVCFLLCSAAQILLAQEQEKKPVFKKARVAYCESGEFANYASTLHGLALGFSEAGLIGDVTGLPYREGQSDTRVIWQWLAESQAGKTLTFAANDYYSFAHKNKDEQQLLQDRIIERLNSGEIDLLIVMGTQAGQALANNRHHVPTFIFSTSNAVQAGIISSAEDSGYEHVWAHMDPTRYSRQLEVFHDLLQFKKLGLVYEPSLEGEAFAALPDVEKVAKERGFELVRAFVKDRQKDQAAHQREMSKAYRMLAEQGVDAVYSTLYFDRDVKQLAATFAPLYEHKIPVFAQQGAAEVRYGALLSVSRADFRGIGRFGVSAISQTLQGAAPRTLPQIYENTPNIVLNMETAEKIGYRPAFDILLAADEIYQSIEGAR